MQPGGFLDRRFELLLKTGLPLMKNILKPLGKSGFIPLGFTATEDARDVGIDDELMMNYFCRMIDRRKLLSLISRRDHCQRFSSPQISDTS